MQLSNVKIGWVFTGAILGYGIFIRGYRIINHLLVGVLPGQEFLFNGYLPKVTPPREHHIHCRVLPEAEQEYEPNSLLQHCIRPQVIQWARPWV